MSFFNSIEALGEGALSLHKGILMSSTRATLFYGIVSSGMST